MKQIITALAIVAALAGCAATQRHAEVATPFAAPARAELVTPQERLGASIAAAGGVAEAATAPHFHYLTTCRRSDGSIRWQDSSWNTVLTGGGNDLLDKYFKGSAYTASWFMLLKGTGSIAAGDTLPSHAGWTEVTPYAGNRPGITFGTTSARSNTATAVTYTINASATVAGACVASVNTGTAGILYSCSDFTAARAVVSGDSLAVTLTVSD